MKRFVAVMVVLGVMAGVMAAHAGYEKKGGEAKLDIPLPKPLFIGTPKNIKTPNLEPPRKGKTRDPYFVPAGAKNVAAGKDITGSDEEPIIGEMEYITDGDKEGGDGSYVELGPGLQHVQIDLEKAYSIHAVIVWHYHSQARVYRDFVVQTSDDPDFITGVTTLYNNDHDNSAGLGIGKNYEYIETYEGRLIEGKGTKARYVRMYSNGSTSSEMNHYIEVDVYATE
jgi:hypothetical protein